ncbi:MAG: regulatory iron-sulfur-containing complex subunit RicT [Bacteroidota bacterium]|nr:regulatory iron-sulfur-containing complex subunit RicT [Bacteroidota bacterium]
MSCYDCTFDLKERGCSSSPNSGSCSKLEAHDWLGDVQNTINPTDIIEVRFKNTRKDYYQNPNGLKLRPGDIIAVEANPGHDIGIVSLVGDLVIQQMKKHKVTYVNGELRKIYRKAKPADIDKWKEAIALERETMLRSRKIASNLNLNMKIGDVEYQGDKTKAIFYYIAEDRVDFRQLIKVLAETFRIRVEMKQIGARQEAGRIGGIGPCGRELCCCTWISNFVSVTTSAARYQEISLNPQKLAGQCGKLKCCLNYELDCYVDAQKDFPPSNIALETKKGRYVFLKADIFKRIYWYAPEACAPSNQIAIPVEKVKEILSLNQHGKSIDKIEDSVAKAQPSALDRELSYSNAVGEESLTRFDEPSNQNRKKRNRKKRGNPSGTVQNSPQPRPQTANQSQPKAQVTPPAQPKAQVAPSVQPKAPSAHANRTQGPSVTAPNPSNKGNRPTIIPKSNNNQNGK